MGQAQSSRTAAQEWVNKFLVKPYAKDKKSDEKSRCGFESFEALASSACIVRKATNSLEVRAALLHTPTTTATNHPQPPPPCPTTPRRL